MFVYTLNLGDGKMSQLVCDSAKEFEDALKESGNFKSVRLEHELRPFFSEGVLTMFRGKAVCKTQDNEIVNYDFTEYAVPENLEGEIEFDDDI